MLWFPTDYIFSFRCTGKIDLGEIAILNLLEESNSSSDESLFGTCSHCDPEYRDSSWSESEVDDIPGKKRKICDVQVISVNYKFCIQWLRPCMGVLERVINTIQYSDCSIDIWY
jgi:hypothetical protein